MKCASQWSWYNANDGFYNHAIAASFPEPVEIADFLQDVIDASNPIIQKNNSSSFEGSPGIINHDIF